jgi:threonine synthase
VPTFFSHLECSVPCGAGPYDPRQAHAVCTLCGAPLVARYDLTGAKRWPKSSLAGREASQWRYREILPLLESDKGVDQPVTLGEGWTPLLRARRLGKALGLDRVYVKDESQNPGESCKARGVSAAMTRVLHVGARTVTAKSHGHGGVAIAAYASRAGLEAVLSLPKDTRRPFVRACELSGARVAPDGAEPPAGAIDLSAYREPYRLEGTKTLGYEIVEQLGWNVPDWIICPAGSGLTITAIWKALSEIAALGWVDAVRRPRLACAQAAGCAPLVRAFGAGEEKATTWDAPQTIADGLRVPSTIGDVLALRALRESGGAAVAAGDAEMIAAMKDFGRYEGLSASPEAGATLHALRVLIGEGRVKASDTVVLVNTSGAAYDLDVLD